MAFNRDLCQNLILSPFDQVVVIPQSRINSKIEYDFSTLKFLEFVEYSPEPPDTTPTMRAALSSLSVCLFSSEADSQMICTVNFAESNNSVRNPSFTFQSGSSTQTLVPNSNWKVSFKIKYGTKTGITLPENLKKSVLVDGNYSATSVFLDFGTVSLNASTTDWSATGLAAGSDGQKALATCLQSYLTMCQNKETGIMAYAISSTTDRVFVPTSIKTSIIPWHNTDKSTSATNANNALVFISTTNNRPMPSQGLSYQGNWFTESDKSNSIMAISKVDFLDAWFIPALSTFDRWSLLWVGKAIRWLWNNRTSGDPHAPDPGASNSASAMAQYWFFSQQCPDSPATNAAWDAQTTLKWFGPETASMYSSTRRYHYRKTIVNPNGTSTDYIYAVFTTISVENIIPGDGPNFLNVNLYTHCNVFHDTISGSTCITIEFSPKFIFTFSPNEDDGVLNVAWTIQNESEVLKISYDSGASLTGYGSGPEIPSTAQWGSVVLPDLFTKDSPINKITGPDSLDITNLNATSTFTFAGNTTYSFQALNIADHGDLIAHLFYQEG